MELAACHTSSAYNFEVAAWFGGNLCTPALNILNFRSFDYFNVICVPASMRETLLLALVTPVFSNHVGAINK